MVVPSTSFFQQFFRTEAAGGLLLLACAGAALVAANSPWADAYTLSGRRRSAVGAGGHDSVAQLHQWINDGLMATVLPPGRPGNQAGGAGRGACVTAPGRAADRGRDRWHGRARHRSTSASAAAGMATSAAGRSRWQRTSPSRLGFWHGCTPRAGRPQGVPGGAGDRGRHGSRPGDRALLYARDRVGCPRHGRAYACGAYRPQPVARTSA